MCERHLLAKPRTPARCPSRCVGFVEFLYVQCGAHSFTYCMARFDRIHYSTLHLSPRWCSMCSARQWCSPKKLLVVQCRGMARASVGNRSAEREMMASRVSPSLRTRENEPSTWLVEVLVEVFTTLSGLMKGILSEPVPLISPQSQCSCWYGFVHATR